MKSTPAGSSSPAFPSLRSGSPETNASSEEDSRLLSLPEKMQGQLELLRLENRDLIEMQRIVRLLINSMLDPIIVVDTSSIVQFINPATTSLLGYTWDELVGQSLNIMIPNPRRAEHSQYVRQERHAEVSNVMGKAREIEVLHKDGQLIPVQIGLSEITLDEQRRFFAGILRDIRPQKENEEQVAYLANHDALTGLLNRRSILERIQEDISRESRKERNQGLVGKLAVIFVDLDRFKPINDRYGHPVGDKVLIEVASRLAQCFQRRDDRVARFGGDEFIIEIVLDESTNMGSILQRLIEMLKEPVMMEEEGETLEIPASASIGIALFPENGKTVNDLVKNADTAMYEAKGGGPNCIKFYTPQGSRNDHNGRRI